MVYVCVLTVNFSNVDVRLEDCGVLRSATECYRVLRSAAEGRGRRKEEAREEEGGSKGEGKRQEAGGRRKGWRMWGGGNAECRMEAEAGTQLIAVEIVPKKKRALWTIEQVR